MSQYQSVVSLLNKLESNEKNIFDNNFDDFDDYFVFPLFPFFFLNESANVEKTISFLDKLENISSGYLVRMDDYISLICKDERLKFIIPDYYFLITDSMR